MSSRKKISILGVTGSVGQSAVKVICANPEAFDVQTVTANKNVSALAESAKILKAQRAVIGDETLYAELKEKLAGTNIECAAGHKAIEQSAANDADLVLAAIVGFAGLSAILAALSNGCNVAIANKEPLVAAGKLICEAAHKSGARLIPVDSEHNAIFQVLEAHNKDSVDKIILTASGGPFRSWTTEKIQTASIDQALKHPNWSMGAKISIDSATMMNKALEVIEAHHLFTLPTEKIEVLIHPESIIHSMVCYTDGSVLAQMGSADMRIPIAHALGWPQRLKIPVASPDFASLQKLTFEKPDFTKFSALSLAYTCIKEGAGACISLNAANEIAVDAFLQQKILFGDIMKIVTFMLEDTKFLYANNALKTVEEITDLNNTVRRRTAEYIARISLNNTRKEA